MYLPKNNDKVAAINAASTQHRHFISTLRAHVCYSFKVWGTGKVHESSLWSCTLCFTLRLHVCYIYGIHSMSCIHWYVWLTFFFNFSANITWTSQYYKCSNHYEHLKHGVHALHAWSMQGPACSKHTSTQLMQGPAWVVCRACNAHKQVIFGVSIVIRIHRVLIYISAHISCLENFGTGQSRS